MTFFREPFEVDEEEKRSSASLAATRAAREIIGVPYWADSALFAAAGIPTVVFGPRGEGRPSVVETASAERCAEIYAAVAAEYCALELEPK